MTMVRVVVPPVHRFVLLILVIVADPAHCCVVVPAQVSGDPRRKRA